MPYAVDTGNGASIAFSDTPYVGQYEELDAGEDTLGTIEDSYLETVGRKTYIAEDLVESGEIKGVTQFDSAADIPELTGEPETVTITWPLKAGQSTPATLSGTGILTKFTRPKFVNNQKQMSEIAVKWDGKTGPVYTAAS